jgi:hypothetical protein
MTCSHATTDKNNHYSLATKTGKIGTFPVESSVFQEPGNGKTLFHLIWRSGGISLAFHTNRI